jgi:hypothetical protein
MNIVAESNPNTFAVKPKQYNLQIVDKVGGQRIDY